MRAFLWLGVGVWVLAFAVHSFTFITGGPIPVSTSWYPVLADDAAWIGLFTLWLLENRRD